MGSVGKNPESVAADLVAEDQLQSYTRAEAESAQLRMPVLLHAGAPHERLYIGTQIVSRGTDSTTRILLPRRSAWAAVLPTSFALTGCQGTMTDPIHSSNSPSSATSPSGEETSPTVVADWPLRFAAFSSRQQQR